MASLSWRLLAFLILALIFPAFIGAHPGSSIAVDSKGVVYFVDTGGGLFKIEAGKLQLVDKHAVHWMALDESGRFAGFRTSGHNYEMESRGQKPAMVLSTDYPVALAGGFLFYAPFNEHGPLELVRQGRDGQRSVAAVLDKRTSGKRLQWVNGLAAGPNGTLYYTENAAIRVVKRGGEIATMIEPVNATGCVRMPEAEPLGPPLLRGLAVTPDGTVFVAASGCRQVLKITPAGQVTTVLTAEAPWSPTGVAVHGNDVYVLEYLHTPTDDRREWVPRVRKVDGGGRVSVLATVER